MQIQKCFLQSDVPASAIQRMVQIHVSHCTKIFSGTVRNKDNVLNFVFSEFREHEVNFPIPHIHFHYKSLLHSWCFVYTLTLQHARGVILLAFAGRAHATHSAYPRKRVSITLPGTADPENLENLQISTSTSQAFSFSQLFDPPFLTQLSFPKQPVRSQKVRTKLNLCFFQVDCRYMMEVNSFFFRKKKSIYCQLHNPRVLQGTAQLWLFGSLT